MFQGSPVGILRLASSLRPAVLAGSPFLPLLDWSDPFQPKEVLDRDKRGSKR